MSITKTYLPEDGICKVTFTLPSYLAEMAKTAHVVGEFNNWDTKSLPMKKAKNGKFTLSLKLQSNNEYQFRYLIDETSWETDWEAYGSTPVPFVEEHNSVVKI